MNLRKHQADMMRICDRILSGEGIKQILCGVTPGGGKSLLPQILASRLIPAIAEKVCWIVPRRALQDQGARGFLDATHRAMLGHNLEAMNSTNAANPTRGHAAYVTTYQAIAADKTGINAKEFNRHKYILVLDEPHHIEESGLWHESIQKLVDRCVLLVMMSGTFERGDGNPIAFVPYVDRENGVAIDFEESETQAVIKYSLRDAWKEKAVIDLDVHYVDCAAQWKDSFGKEHEVKSLAKAKRKTSQALYTALHSEAALQLLDMGVKGWQETREKNPRAKLLVVAATIEQAKRYTDWFKALGMPVEIATSDDSDAAHQAIKDFKRTGTGSLNILITVSMAYEGLDVPAVTHLICLTHIRTKPWIEQVVHRATRVDYQAGPYETQKAHIYAPDDAPFRACMDYLFAEREAFRACSPTMPEEEDREDQEEMEPLERMGQEYGPLFSNNQGSLSGIQIIGSSVVGVRRDPLLEHIRTMTVQGREITQTPAERIRSLKERIEARCRRHERTKRLKHGAVNGALKKKFGKSRGEMTENELEKVWAHVQRHY